MLPAVVQVVLPVVVDEWVGALTVAVDGRVVAIFVVMDLGWESTMTTTVALPTARVTPAADEQALAAMVPG